MWELYDRLIEQIPDDVKVEEILAGQCLTMVKAGGRTGVVASNRLQSRPFQCDVRRECRELSWRQAAALVKSWNFAEAAVGGAAINAYYNDRGQVNSLLEKRSDLAEMPGCDVFRSYAGDGMRDRKVATVGHFYYAEEMLKTAKDCWILEREPGEGDYPDSACEYLLPEADLVFITGFTVVNKTLPRLLELSGNARVILVGPSVPMSEVLFEYGVEELAGTLLPDRQAAELVVRYGARTAAAKMGEPVRIMKNKN